MTLVTDIVERTDSLAAEAAWIARLAGLRAHVADEPVRDVAEAARAAGADLVAVRSGPDAADAAGRALNRGLAVLAVPDAEPGRWRGRIAVGYDGSRDADAALAVARAIAGNASALLDRVDLVYVDTSASAAGEADAAVIDKRRTAVIEWWLKERAEDMPVPVRPVRLVGDPAEELAYLSEDVDLLVVGSRGRALLRRALTGSVSRELIATARSPLLIVPPDAVTARGTARR